MRDAKKRVLVPSLVLLGFGGRVVSHPVSSLPASLVNLFEKLLKLFGFSMLHKGKEFNGGKR